MSLETVQSIPVPNYQLVFHEYPRHFHTLITGIIVLFTLSWVLLYPTLFFLILLCFVAFFNTTFFNLNNNNNFIFFLYLFQVLEVF